MYVIPGWEGALSIGCSDPFAAGYTQECLGKQVPGPGDLLEVFRQYNKPEHTLTGIQRGRQMQLLKNISTVMDHPSDVPVAYFQVVLYFMIPASPVLTC